MTIDDVGEVRPRGEFWTLTYAACGHEQWFPRGEMNYAEHLVAAEVRAYYANCQAFHSRTIELRFYDCSRCGR